MRGRWCGILLLPTLLLALTACGPVDFSGRAGAILKALQGTPAEQRAPSSPKRRATLERDIRRHLEAGNYHSALNLLRNEIKGGMPETALAGEYGRAINGLLDKADMFRKQDQPEKAGELFRSAHDGFPKTEAVAKGVRLTPPEILTCIEDCAGKLMERGLVAYRAGDLDGAIRMWKMIHTFSPRHQASLKALKTAEVQRANLEKVGARK